jgi:hypothetical protein
LVDVLTDALDRIDHRHRAEPRCVDLAIALSALDESNEAHIQANHARSPSRSVLAVKP